MQKCLVHVKFSDTRTEQTLECSGNGLQAPTHIVNFCSDQESSSCGVDGLPEIWVDTFLVATSISELHTVGGGTSSTESLEHRKECSAYEFEIW